MKLFRKAGAWALAGALSMLIAGQADLARADQGGEGSSAAGAQAEEQDAAAQAAIAVKNEAPYGEYLVDADQRPLYLFTPDQDAQGSTCYGPCAEAWPPVLTEGDPTTVAGALDPEKLGTITRRDGTTQATYEGWPLYYFQRDQRGSPPRGQDIHSFGGGWYLISPAGKKIETSELKAERAASG